MRRYICATDKRTNRRTVASLKTPSIVWNIKTTEELRSWH